MSKVSPVEIRILEKENNKRGDLFGRLMGDLFLALGYDHVRLNIHKTGREVDIEAIHRTERRQVIAECKATEAKIGGNDVNTFVGGALDLEKRKGDLETTGYFISLSGFTEPAIEQEREAGGDRVTLLNGTQVVEELIKGRIIAPREEAMERAGRCAGKQPDDLVPETVELLAHEMGWIWAIYFSRNKQRTHFALIHADGDALAPALAESVIKADKSVGGDLHSLNYLSPSGEAISDDSIEEARESYFAYLSRECGEITLEGLPADEQVGYRRLDLEHIFVPLYLNPSTEYKRTRSLESPEREEEGPSKDRKSVGEILSEQPRLAILADPGGGKTTLLKRLAIAYAFPKRRKLLDDSLPDRKWLPLLIRCRQLSNLAKSSIGDILSFVPNWAEMTQLAEPFSLLVHRALRDGEVLLLIDGLDEVSDEGERVAFITQLRTFLAVYPAVSVIITSREAGFRIVGGALSACCQHYRIADFDDDDITRLTSAWHREVYGDKEEVRQDAQKLAKTICESERVRDLAKNPLLLTTLLLVKRWVGHAEACCMGKPWRCC